MSAENAAAGERRILTIPLPRSGRLVLVAGHHGYGHRPIRWMAQRGGRGVGPSRTPWGAVRSLAVWERTPVRPS